MICFLAWIDFVRDKEFLMRINLFDGSIFPNPNKIAEGMCVWVIFRSGMQPKTGSVPSVVAWYVHN